MDKQKIYFPNLNGLRFIAAFLVIIQHIEQIKSIFLIDNCWKTSPFIAISGKLGVVLFFVLSGFLITYLLLSEEASFQNIIIRKFYIRRILRIWPLYFLIIILAFFILPHISIFTLPAFGKEFVYKDLFLKLLLYILFLPNLVVSALGIVPYASHTWSIGTEEQYYLVWPILLKYFKKHRISLMILIVIIYLSVAFLLQSTYSDFIPHKNVMKTFWSNFNIDCMAIGGVYALLLFQKNAFLKVVLNNYVFYSTIILVIILLINGVYIPFIHYEFYAVLFGIIILNFAANDKMQLSLENKALNYLGNISYGIYMFHPIAIVLVLSIAPSINLMSNWFIYLLSILITIGMAAFSYTYFESFFLKFKNKFSDIISGTEAK